MIDSRKLVVGRVYFMVTYDGPTLSRPIILSFEYLGKDIHGRTVDSEESGHYFRFMPPFRSEEPSEEDHTPHWFSDNEVADKLVGLDGLIEELTSRGEAWEQSGP